MRTSFRLATIAVFFACQATPAVTVAHLSSGARPEAEKGDALKLKRGAQEAYAGANAGFFVIRSTQDWQNLWPAGKEAPLPPTLDTSRQMVILAVAESKDSVAVKLSRVFDSGPFIDVFVTETSNGAGCTDKLEHPPFDAVVTDRIDKPVKFWVKDEKAETCGGPPTAEVKCRVGAGAAWAANLTAAPGDTIDCEMTADSHGRFEVVDRSLTMASLPGGTSAKLAYSQGPMRGTFTIDIFGTYVVKGEAVDDADRHGSGTATIDVLPSKTKDVFVQLVWTNFDRSDDPDTFPRVKLSAELPAARGQKARVCSAETPAPPCDVHTKSAYTQMSFKAGTQKVPLSVTYTDERIEQGPAVCIQLWSEGAKKIEVCDKHHRDASAKWEPGVVDLSTGTLVVKEEASNASASDAGASKK